MNPPAQVVEAWQAAATDLGLDITAPYRTESGAVFVALVKGFGSPNGTLVDWLGHSDRQEPTAAAGAYVSFVSAEAYGSYDRGLFIETLNDWGLKLEVQAPSWYSGEPPTS